MPTTTKQRPEVLARPASTRLDPYVRDLLLAILATLEGRYHQPPAAALVQFSVDRVLGGADPGRVATDMFDCLDSGQLDSLCIWPEVIPNKFRNLADYDPA